MSDLPVIQTFHFDDAEILWLDLDGEKYVVPKRICESFGLSWGSQQQKLTKNPRYQGFINHIDIDTVTGRKPILILHASKYHSWINQIDTDKVGNGAREKLLTFQRDSDRALHEYWTTGQAIHPSMTPSGLPPELQALLKLSENLLQSVLAITGLSQQHTQAIADLQEAVNETKAQVAEIKAQGSLGSGYTTIVGYANIQRRYIPEAKARQAARLCAKRCRALNLEIGKTPSERWGFVNTYPEWIIAEVWHEMGLDS